jgi:hypothetical protein
MRPSSTASPPAIRTTRPRWVAALYFKDSQLLLVSAQYSAPSLLTEKMRVKDYRDIYLALFSSPVAGTKVFVMDSNANGLSARPSNGQAPDMWEQKDTTVMFDGEWRKAKMSEDDYRKAYADADSHYAKLLRCSPARPRARAARKSAGLSSKWPTVALRAMVGNFRLRS